ncbi:hypothetical protein ACLB2K_062846 [Fragaria x ananassa]
MLMAMDPKFQGPELVQLNKSREDRVEIELYIEINEARVKNEKLNEELKKLQALVAPLAPNSQDERALESNEDDQDPEEGANKGGKINEDLKDKEVDKVAEEDDDKEADKDPEGTGKEDEAAENIAQLPTQNSEDLYVEELERVEEELKKKKKAEDETKAYCEQPPESPPRRTVAEKVRWSPKTPVIEMPSFDLGISPWDPFRRNTILSALGPPALKVLFPAAQEQLPTHNPSPLADVGYYNPPPLGVRRSRRHTRATRQNGSDIIVTSQYPLCRNTILSALGPPALTVLFPAAQEQLPNRSPILGLF